MTERRRIHAINIRDFRGIDALDLDFTDGTGAPLDVVVLAGANGSGKTSVLEAIFLANDSLEEHPPTGACVRFGRTTSYIEVRGRSSLNTLEIEANGESSAMNDGKASLEYFSVRRSLYPLADPSPRVREESQRVEELEKRLISAYYRSLRGRGGKQSPIFTRIQTLWKRFDARGRRLEVLPRDNNPGSGDLVLLCDGGPIPDDITSFAMARNLASTRPDIPTLVPLDALSSGQMALFAFAGPLVFRDEPADIVLIDEPEQHMHVQWQRLLLPALRELCPDTQFIVATHSEEILDSVLSYERFILVDNDDPRARDVEPGAAAE